MLPLPLLLRLFNVVPLMTIRCSTHSLLHRPRRLLFWTRRCRWFCRRRLPRASRLRTCKLKAIGLFIVFDYTSHISSPPSTFPTHPLGPCHQLTSLPLLRRRHCLRIRLSPFHTSIRRMALHRCTRDCMPV